MTRIEQANNTRAVNIQRPLVVEYSINFLNRTADIGILDRARIRQCPRRHRKQTRRTAAGIICQNNRTSIGEAVGDGQVRPIPPYTQRL